MIPSFNYQVIEWTNDLWCEMESYWNNFGDDLIKWINRFENEIIFRVVTGIKNDAIASYYYTITPENNNNEKKLKESENFVKSIDSS